MSYEDIRARLVGALETVAETDETISQRVATVAAMLARADQCAAQVANDGLMIPGSAGQLVAHPLLSEERALRTHADRVWAECLPLEDGNTGTGAATDDSVSLKAKRAADARWGRHRAAGEIA
ncbi:hypothetical protein [Nocardiopsis eucommiae]|uniref:hypothetical protein n=1 Tax=Nocardiopsis eucommiae TaxID=2831970 RepID=UPI003D75C46C